MKLRITEAASRYEAHCIARGLEMSTIKGQQSTLRGFVAVVGDLQLDSITPEHIDRVFNTYAWQASTRNNKIGQLRAFFSWCRGARLMNGQSNPMIGWRQRAVPEKFQLRIPHAEWPRLFDACIHPQERIVIATGLYLFLRASEQQALTIGNLDLNSDTIHVWRVKTKRWDALPVSLELGGELRRWLSWLAESNELDTEHHLICARNKDMKHDADHRWVAGSGTMNLNRPVHKPHLIVQRVLRRAGYEVAPQTGEHTLRRSGARAYFDSLVHQGYDGALRQVQALLDHRNSAQTERYLGLSLDKRKLHVELAGKPMFPVVENAAVIPIRKGL